MPRVRRAQATHRALMRAPQLDTALLQGLAQQLRLSASDARAFEPALQQVRQLAEWLCVQSPPALLLGDTLFRGSATAAQVAAAVLARRASMAQS